MNNGDWYIIKDFESFIDSTRALVFNSFGNNKTEAWDDIGLDILPEDQDELDRVLSHNEAVLIAKEILKRQTHKKTQEVRYMVSDSRYRKLIDAFNHRMIGNLLSGLVNKGLVEASFDEEANDFVFWVKDEKNPEDSETH